MSKQIEPLTLDRRIDLLSDEQLRFCLRVMVLAKYLSEETLTKAIDLCDSVRFDR